MLKYIASILLFLNLTACDVNWNTTYTCPITTCCDGTCTTSTWVYSCQYHGGICYYNPNYYYYYRSEVGDAGTDINIYRGDGGDSCGEDAGVCE